MWWGKRKIPPQNTFYHAKRQDTTATVIPCLLCYFLLKISSPPQFEFLILHTWTYERECNKKEPPTKVGDSCLVAHCPRQPNLQIVCSTAMQSSSAFRKEFFPQSRSSCFRTFARESARKKHLASGRKQPMRHTPSQRLYILLLRDTAPYPVFPGRTRPLSM